MNRYILLISFLLCVFIGKAQTYSLQGRIQSDEKLDYNAIEVLLVEENRFVNVDENARFKIDSLLPGKYTLSIFSKGFQTLVKYFVVDSSNIQMLFNLQAFTIQVNTVNVTERKSNEFGITRLKPVEGTAIYAGKKNDVINMSDMAANLATNNSRQIYSKVAGMNIWESDGAGIQLDIGGRGLNPSRVSNFNVRQNGYDISADALGYPESYYSPPAEAIERIEIVRGAASLQYGTQFGGLLNFKLKDGPEEKKFELVSRQSIGSFGLFNTFNSVGGNHKKLKYYVYAQYKTGKGWRKNSQFDVYNAHSNFSYQLKPNLKIGFEYTFMHYLAQQPGGLTDVMFNNDPQQSIRARNWFKVNWNLFALTLDYKISSRSNFNFRSFGLHAGRDAVGVLNQITRADLPENPRDLLSDRYNNIGFENRFLHRYELFKQNSIFLVGMRYYNGMTHRRQGSGSADSLPNFNYVNPDQPEASKYDFPSGNLAVFTENVFYIKPQLSITPGLRYEYISTNAKGYYFDRYISINNDTLKNEMVFEERNNNRKILLAGIGLSFKPSEEFEVYSNFSQNYRSINFNDMRIANPNYQVDPHLQDETGYSLDFGIRGNKDNWYNYDVSLFMLTYNNRIGTILRADRELQRTYRYRTNISNSRSLGLESFVEINLLSLIGNKESKNKLSVFSTFSYMNARYINSQEEAIDGNFVELVPELIFKGGLSYRKKSFQLNYQYSYTSEQYTDATNADYSPNAIYGLVPQYTVMDFSAKYMYKERWMFECGVNNLMNNLYFSRRASGYPGPGIIPSNPRNYYLSIGVKL